MKTERIRLSSAVTVLSSDDPVRVFQDFAQVDLLSGGRAEIMAGRGSFVESFPLFGLDLDDYDEALRREARLLLLELRERTHVTWSGRHRAPLRQAGVYPRPVQERLPVWVAVGGSPQSVVRAGTLGLPLTVAIIGGRPGALRPARRALPRGARGRGPRSGGGEGRDQHPRLRRGDERSGGRRLRGALPADDEPHRPRTGLAALGPTGVRGAAFPRGAVAVGSPEQVAEKLLFEHDLFGHDRYIIQMSVGAVEHAEVLRSMERFAADVALVVREEVTRRAGRRLRPELSFQ